MQEVKDNSLFTELTSEESASVNGACNYYCRDDRSRYDDCYYPRRRIVYRRKCDGSYIRVVRYW